MSDPKFAIMDNIATITLSSPETRNAITRPHISQIKEALEEWKSTKVSALIINAMGNTFCSGMSFDEFDKGDWSQNPISDLCDHIENFPAPTICSLIGGVYGGGVEIAISCDFRVADRNLRLAVPAAKLGINYGSKGIARAIQLIGIKNVRKIYLLGERLEIAELIKAGFVDFVAKDKKFVQFKSEELAFRISKLDSRAVNGMKNSILKISNCAIDIESDFCRFQD